MPAHSIRKTVAVAALTAIGLISGAAAATSASADATTVAPASSGPTWLSGVSTGPISQFENWLGRDESLDSTWAATDSWADMVNVGWLPTSAQFPGTLSIGMAMLPTDGSADFSSCANGDYNSYYAQMGSTLESMGDGASFIRLGWEFNGNWMNWFIGNTTPAKWIGCWQQEVTALRSTDPDAQIVWNANANSSDAGHAAAYYPGNSYVDVVGVDYYDMWPALNSETAWNDQYNSTESDGMPDGMGSWLAFAVAHGKKLAVPEWGTVVDQGGGGDDPYYIKAMYNFFKTNASNIAYEAYFDTQAGHEISSWDSTTEVPKAAAEYKALFGPTAATTTGTPTTGTTTTPTTPTTPTTVATTTTTPTSPSTTPASHHVRHRRLSRSARRLRRLARHHRNNRRHEARSHRLSRGGRRHLRHNRTPRRNGMDHSRRAHRHTT